MHIADVVDRHWRYLGKYCRFASLHDEIAQMYATYLKYITYLRFLPGKNPIRSIPTTYTECTIVAYRNTSKSKLLKLCIRPVDSYNFQLDAELIAEKYLNEIRHQECTIG